MKNKQKLTPVKGIKELRKLSINWKKICLNEEVVAFKTKEERYIGLAVPKTVYDDTVGINFHEIDYTKNNKKFINSERFAWSHREWEEKVENIEEFEHGNLQIEIFKNSDEFVKRSGIEFAQLSYCHYCESYFEADTEGQNLSVNQEMVCSDCFAEAFLKIDADDFIFTKNTFDPDEHFKKAKYVHFDYEEVLNGFKEEGWEVIDTGWVGTLDGHRYDSEIEMIKNAMEPDRKYLVILDRATHNCCTIGINLLRKTMEIK